MVINRYHGCSHTYSLQCVLEFQSDHARWRSKRSKWGMHLGGPLCRPWRRINKLYSDI